MKLLPPAKSRGFAIIIVMIVIVVLGVLAGSFALAMKVETRLAGNASDDSELEWLGRSGVEMARYFLGQSMNQPYTALNQLWAGGPGGPNETNSVLMAVSLKNNQLGDGRFSVRIADLERKMNINLNLPDPEKKQLLNRALGIVGVDAGDSTTLEDSVLDWLDPDDASHLSGTESDFYMTLPRPYFAKNGPMDDLAELLLVRGVTPEMYWGPSAPSHQSKLVDPNAGRSPRPSLAIFPVGLVDLFTPLSNGRININTASAYVLQLLPGVDENVAANILRARAGLDGVEGTEDDTPFQNLAGLNPAMVPGIIPELMPRYSALCGVTSASFEVTVDARIGRHHRTYTAIVRRNRPDDVQILQFGWK